MPSAALGISVGHSMGEAAVSPGPFPPFARLVGDVAVVGEQLDEARESVKRGLHGLVELGPSIASIDVVAGDAVLKGIQSGGHRGERGAAKRGGDIAPIEDETAFG